MNQKKVKALVGAAVLLAYIVVLVGLVIGWVANIVGILHTIGEPITGLFIARLVGTVVFPLGGVLGYF